MDSLEGKTLLSSLPVLSTATFNQAMHQIDRAAGTFAKTHNANQFDAALPQSASTIPTGTRSSADLAATRGSTTRA